MRRMPDKSYFPPYLFFFEIGDFETTSEKPLSDIIFDYLTHKYRNFLLLFCKFPFLQKV